MRNSAHGSTAVTTNRFDYHYTINYQYTVSLANGMRYHEGGPVDATRSNDQLTKRSNHVQRCAKHMEHWLTPFTSLVLGMRKGTASAEIKWHDIERHQPPLNLKRHETKIQNSVLIMGSNNIRTSRSINKRHEAIKNPNKATTTPERMTWRTLLNGVECHGEELWQGQARA